MTEQHPSNQEFVIRETKYGQGVFAARPYAAGDKIMDYRGKVVPPEEQPEPYYAVPDRYVQVGKRDYMGPSGGPDDLVNHSCDPNAGLVISGHYRVYLKAIKDIPAGAEITFDYSTTMDEDNWEMDCSCGSASCRRRVRDFKKLPRPVQERYAALGIVPEYNLEYLKDRSH